MQPNRRPAPSTIEQDFLGAIERLTKGKPRNLALRQLATRGMLKINFSTVAKEAGRARTLIAHEGCAYPAIRTRIQALMAPVGAPSSLSTVVFRLRREVKELKDKLQAQQHQMADYFLARQAAERDRDRWKSAYNALVKNEPRDGNVVPLGSKGKS